MLEAETDFGEQASFAEIDCDANVKFSKSIPVLNVPLVAYYRDGKLVAALIGADQNVRARMERVLRGEKIGYKDGTTPHNPAMQRTEAAGIVSRVRQLLGRGSGR
jgi:thioredoxin-like negative regulator of GroEL